MEQQQAVLLDLFTSMDDRKRLLGLAVLQRDAAQGNSSLPMLHPLILRQFIAHQKSDKAGHFVGRKLAYMVMRTMPVYGPTWVSLANAIDRDVQAASICGEDDPLTGEVGVYAMRTVLAMPFTHIEEYVRSRWDAVLAAVSMARNVTLRICGIDAMTIYASPPAGMERHEMISFVRRIVVKPRLAEVVRRLLLDPHEDICVRGFQLLAVLQMTANVGEQTSSGTPSLLISSSPVWLMHALGLTMDVSHEITNRACRLPCKHQQCVHAPLTALTLASAKLHVPSSSVVLTVCDAILLPTLHNDWDEAGLVSAAICLVSIAAQQTDLLISLYPHLAICAEKILLVIHRHLDHTFETLAMQSNLVTRTALEQALDTRSKAELPSGTLEVLFSLLSILPHSVRVRHCLALLNRCSTAQRKHPIPLVDAADEFIPPASFLWHLTLIVARVLSTTLVEVSGDIDSVMSSSDPSQQSTAATESADDSCARYLGRFLHWCSENIDVPIGREIYSMFLRTTAGHVAQAVTRAQHLMRQLAQSIQENAAVEQSDELLSHISYISAVLRLLSNHTVLHFDRLTHILINSHFRAILAMISDFVSGSSGLSAKCKALPLRLLAQLRHVLEEFELTLSFVEESVSSIIEESIVGSMAPSISPSVHAQLTRLVHVLCCISLSYIYATPDSVMLTLRRSKHHGAECLVLPSEVLCRVAVSVTQAILMFSGIDLGPKIVSFGADVADQSLITPEFVADFSRAIDIIKLLYSACLRMNELRGDHSNESPVITFLHERLMPHWAWLKEELKMSDGTAGIVLTLISNANTEIEEFVFAENPQRVEFVARRWIAQALAAAPLFLPPASRWGEGPMPLPRCVHTKTITGTGDPVQVTLSYVIIPTVPAGYVEVAACLTNTTSLVLQQINFQYASYVTALHDEVTGETTGEIHVRYSHEPKRSLFQASLDAAAPSSSSYLARKSRGAFCITNFPPKACVIIPGVYMVYRRLAKPIIPASATGKRSLALLDMHLASRAEVPLKFGCRIDVSVVSTGSSQGGEDAAHAENDLVAVARQHSEMGAAGDDGDDSETENTSGEAPKRRTVVVLPQHCSRCEIALQHLFFSPSHLDLPVSGTAIAAGVLALLQEHGKEKEILSSLLPFTSFGKSEIWTRSISLGGLPCTASCEFPLGECGTFACGLDERAAWVACLPTSWILPTDCNEFAPLTVSSTRAAQPVSLAPSSVDHFSVELLRDGSTGVMANVTVRCTSQLWGTIILSHPQSKTFLESIVIGLQKFEHHTLSRDR